MTCQVNLYGKLAERYGAQFNFAISTPAEAFRALVANFPSIRKEILEGSFKVVIGDYSTGYCIDETELGFLIGSRPLHIVPVVEGAGGRRGGAVKTIIGIIIMVVAFYYGMGATGVGAAGPSQGMAVYASETFSVTYGQLALTGLNMTLSGVSQMTSPHLKTENELDYTSREDPEQRSSFVFNGPRNAREQGGPVPLVYGRMKTGSVMFSSSVRVEQL